MTFYQILILAFLFLLLVAITAHLPKRRQSDCAGRKSCLPGRKNQQDPGKQETVY